MTPPTLGLSDVEIIINRSGVPVGVVLNGVSIANLRRAIVTAEPGDLLMLTMTVHVGNVTTRVDESNTSHDDDAASEYSAP